MKLSEVKSILPTLNEVVFKLENGTTVPSHYHVTEIGNITKQFIDCGGVVRHENLVSFQLWTANDTDHRIEPGKMLAIIEQSENRLNLKDAEVEIEYQTSSTIGRYALAFDGNAFILQNKTTACLASDHCGIPQTKRRVNLASLSRETPGCNSETTCC